MAVFTALDGISDDAFFLRCFQLKEGWRGQKRKQGEEMQWYFIYFFKVCSLFLHVPNAGGASFKFPRMSPVM